jgi:nucleotide-binding universal stress UspA family protein
VKVLIAVQGDEGAGYFQRAVTSLRLSEAEAVLVVHVLDETRRAELEFGRERFRGHRELGSRRGMEITEAEEGQAREVVRAAKAALIELGVLETQLREVLVRGRPKEAVRDLAEREGIDLLVVGARGGKPGPHSLGKTARFLVDHAPHGVLLLRPE